MISRDCNDENHYDCMNEECDCSCHEDDVEEDDDFDDTEEDDDESEENK